MKCNENKSSTSKISSSGSEILQKVRYQYHKLNNIHNIINEASMKKSCNRG